VLYVGVDLATSLCEVFGQTRGALLCPRWRVARLQPTASRVVFDLCSPGAAMAIGALPALADAQLPRTLTQEWARAIYEDQPAQRRVTGIRYRSAYNGDYSLALWGQRRQGHHCSEPWWRRH
jgi:RES domain